MSLSHIVDINCDTGKKRSVGRQITTFNTLLQIKTITSVLKVLTYIFINNITAHPIELAAILVIMSVLAFETAVILCL